MINNHYFKGQSKIYKKNNIKMKYLRKFALLKYVNVAERHYANLSKVM